MSWGSTDIEVIGQGRDHRPPLRLRTPFARLTLHPVLALILAAIVGASAWVGYALTQPRIPAVAVSEPVDRPGDATGTQAPWQVGSDGRPAKGVRVTFAAVVSATGRTDQQVTVLGISGPGITGTVTSPVVLSADHATAVNVVADLDCRAVALPVHRADYDLQLRVVAGSRATTGNVPGGGLSVRWAQAVTQACGSWLARRDLTVVKASATVDSTSPRADLVLIIDNTGAQPAYLGPGQSFGGLSVSGPPGSQASVPPHSRSTLRLHVDIRGCDAVPASLPTDTSAALPTTAELGIVALVGSRPSFPDPQAPPAYDGEGPTGIVIAPGPRATIGAAMRSACADLDPFVTLIADHGLVVDPGQAIIAVRIVIDGTPGRVSDVQLVSDSPGADTSSFTPMWSTSPVLIPSASGQVTAVLRYRVARGATCQYPGAFLPGFTLVAHAPYQGHVKTVTYRQFIDASAQGQTMQLLQVIGCPSASSAGP